MMHWMLIFFLFPLQLASAECEFSPEGIMKVQRQILRQAETVKKSTDLAHAVRGPLDCLLKIQLKGPGLLRPLASAALRPLLGGQALQGTTNDSRHEKIAKALTATSLQDRKFLKKYTRGQWSYYDLFCKLKDQSNCGVFLPSDKQIQEESPLIGASSLLLLRSAYKILHGKPKQQVAQQIKDLHQKITDSDPLKKQVIDEIYQEFFPEITLPLRPLT